MTYYAFLRAVNLSSSTKIDMTILKRYIKETYSVSIETYKNSGNIIISDPYEKENIIKIIEESILDLFKKDIVVIGRNKDELNHCLGMNPFSGSEYEKPKTVLYILEKEIDENNLLEFKKRNFTEEEYWYNGKTLYVYYKNGIGRSKLTIAVIEKTLESKATGRNVNTIEELVSKW